MFRKLLGLAPNRESSDRVVSIAQRALKHPGSMTIPEIKSLAASVLSQAGRVK